MALNTLIVEDNPQAAAVLVEMLSKNNTLNWIGTATTLAQAKEMIATHHPSLLFLDVELPDGNGVDFWNEQRATCSWFMHAIFYTAFGQYAIQALRARAYDYLVKPVQQQELDVALGRFFADCTEQLVKMQNATPAAPQQSVSPLLVLDNHSHRISLKSSEICLFRYISERKIWEALCMNGECYTLHHGVNAARLLKITSDFVQVHKSYIVNAQHIARIENNRIVFFPPYDELMDVQIGKIYRNDLFSRFCQL